MAFSQKQTFRKTGLLWKICFAAFFHYLRGKSVKQHAVQNVGLKGPRKMNASGNKNGGGAAWGMCIGYRK